MPGSDGTIISSMTTCGDSVQACVANAAVKAAASRYADRIMSSPVAGWDEVALCCNAISCLAFVWPHHPSEESAAFLDHALTRLPVIHAVRTHVGCGGKPI